MIRIRTGPATPAYLREWKVPCAAMLKVSTIFLLVCSTFVSSTYAAASDKKITVVTVRNVPPQERDYYLDALKQFSIEAITQFLKGLNLTKEQMASEMEAVDLQSLAGRCLDQNTLLGIYQALSAACTTGRRDDFDFISTIILPKFNSDVSKITTDFFPYGLGRLDGTDIVRSGVLEYVENYPELGNRETFNTLIVLGFLNAYWDHAKDKPKLSEVELSILYTGFGQYGDKLRSLCPSFSNDQQSRCRTIAHDTSQLALKAKQKQ